MNNEQGKIESFTNKRWEKTEQLEQSLDEDRKLTARRDEPSRTSRIPNIKRSVTAGWTKIDEKTAKQHPYYGFDGWIVIFLLLQYTGYIVSFAFIILNLPMHEYFQGPAVLSLCVTLFMFTWVILVNILLFRYEDATVRKTYYYLGGRLFSDLMVFSVFLYFFPIGQNEFFLHLMSYSIATVAWTAIWMAYFFNSKRVNVTYRNWVRLDPIIARTGSDQEAVREKVANPNNIQEENVSTESKPETVHKSEGYSTELEERLRALKKILEEGLINEQDFEEKKKDILKAI